MTENEKTLNHKENHQDEQKKTGKKRPGVRRPAMKKAAPAKVKSAAAKTETPKEKAVPKAKTAPKVKTAAPKAKAAPARKAAPKAPVQAEQKAAQSANGHKKHSTPAKSVRRPNPGKHRQSMPQTMTADKPIVSATLQLVGKKPASLRSKASEHPSRATLRMIPLGEIGRAHV